MTPVDNVPVAVNCWVVPTAMVGVDGATVMDATVATVSVVEPETTPKVAVMVVGPVVMAVASPVVLLMVATLVAEELHVTDAVKSFVVLFEYVPMALNCRVVPTAMVGASGVTAMETSVTGTGGAAPSSPPPKQLIKVRGKNAKNKSPQKLFEKIRFFIFSSW